ncbi:MAG: hypothetical protein JWO92_2516 [Chitinophagaceae bacterium]|nr:hypothetical protein [Chitinophagaceae bacterium]
MAENKKSFILYADLIHTVEKMPKGKQADLFMTILKYVNDKNPVVDDLIVGLVWEPIKLQLKRDLKDWEAIKDDRSNGGKLGNLKRWNSDLYQQVLDKKITMEEAEIIAKNRKASHTDKTVSHRVANVAVNDTVTVNDINIKKETDFVCYDAEEFILNNQIVFEKICIATGKKSDEVKKHLHDYHLWMAKKENYPLGKKAVEAGIESWILNEKNFNKNKTNGKGTNAAGNKPGTSEARVTALEDWSIGGKISNGP